MSNLSFTLIIDTIYWFSILKMSLSPEVITVETDSWKWYINYGIGYCDRRRNYNSCLMYIELLQLHMYIKLYFPIKTFFLCPFPSHLDIRIYYKSTICNFYQNYICMNDSIKKIHLSLFYKV